MTGLNDASVAPPARSDHGERPTLTALMERLGSRSIAQTGFAHGEDRAVAHAETARQIDNLVQSIAAFSGPAAGGESKLAVRDEAQRAFMAASGALLERMRERA